tara:strand:- start:740 stop:1123 length:384 start_codon:yes stop_codon:yes gene_type:complete
MESSTLNENTVNNYIFTPTNKNDLQTAVDLWCENRAEAQNIYGLISNWNTSLITDMSNLFLDKMYFNDNINNWDVSSVTNMTSMFDGAFEFNHLLNSWNVSSVTDMDEMFEYATLFDRKNALWYNFN